MATLTGKGVSCPLFDSFSLELIEDPYPHYDRLRTTEPVYWEPVLQAWVLSRQDDVRAVLDDSSFQVISVADSIAEFGSRTGKEVSSLVQVIDAVPFFQSGERHRLSRRSLGRVLTLTPFRNLESRAEDIAAALAAGLSGRREFDAVTDFSDQVSALMMVDILGLPRSDTALLLKLGNEIIRVFDVVPPTLYERLNLKCADALGHLSERIAVASAAGENSGLTLYFQDVPLDGQAKLTAAAAHVFASFFIGSLTTSSLISFCIDALLERPDLYASARGDVSLAAGIVSETVRLESPVQRVVRVAGQDRSFGGNRIQSGQRVLLLLGAANRDPSAFPQPDDLEPARAGTGDVAFGSGDHLCIGAALARLESRIALTHFLRLPRMERSVKPKARYPGLTVRRLTSLPVRFAGDSEVTS